MYNIIFYYKYQQQENKGRDNGRFQGSILVFFALIVHVCLIASIAGKYVWTNIDLKFLNSNKIVQSSFLVLCMFGVYYYYTSDRIKKIESKYLANEWFENYGGLITICLIFIPLLIFIAVLNS